MIYLAIPLFVLALWLLILAVIIWFESESGEDSKIAWICVVIVMILSDVGVCLLR